MSVASPTGSRGARPCASRASERFVHFLMHEAPNMKLSFLCCLGLLLTSCSGADDDDRGPVMAGAPSGDGRVMGGGDDPSTGDSGFGDTGTGIDDTPAAPGIGENFGAGTPVSNLPGTGTGTGTGFADGTGTGTGYGSNAPIGTGTGANVGAGFATGEDTGTSTGTGTGTGTDTGTNGGTGGTGGTGGNGNDQDGDNGTGGSILIVVD